MKLIINKLVYKNLPRIDSLRGRGGFGQSLFTFLGGRRLLSMYSDILLIFKYSERGYSGKWRYIYLDILTPP